MNVQRHQIQPQFEYVITLTGEEAQALHDTLYAHKDTCGQHNIDLRIELERQCPDPLRRRW